MKKINDVAPDAIEYLERDHNRIWYRSGFSEASKCDYLTNNVSESFNAQIRHLKGLLLHELVDGLRELFMEEVVKIVRSDDDIAEVTLIDRWNNTRRHSVDLKNQKCSCREWQITGKPCRHALAWILSNRGVNIGDYVHEYYSVARFRAAYEGRVEALPDRSRWPAVDLGFKVYPPLLGRSAGRPRKVRIRGCLEKNATKKKVKCSRCKEFGRFAKTCQMPVVGEDGESATPKRKMPATDDIAGPSQNKKKTPKKKKSPKRKKTPKKKKTPAKKQAEAAPAPRVVRSLKAWLNT
ncbi:uncharacterized protein LOC120678000 [Panicum virgatum]|uniref:uncharacterized protein LOC120678000 n=1 Tax=Panicum virgatum TaxID=38727 RepID=UPI0019D587DD|nr:uncharacterized protein LOC120678000 [Panicum virgatum]